MTKYGSKEKGLLKNYHQNDERYTPAYAIEPLIKLIPKRYIIYEPCGINEETGLKSNIPTSFQKAGYTTFETSIHEGIDFLELTLGEISEHVSDKPFAIITNPPYSMKTQFML